MLLPARNPKKQGQRRKIKLITEEGGENPFITINRTEKKKVKKVKKSHTEYMTM